MKEVGIYIHIPFCKSKCLYCDFYSMSASKNLIERYFNALTKEIIEVGKQSQDVTIKTIYIGGGTPSFVDSKYILNIMEIIKRCFKISDNCETTIEVNPGSATVEKLRDYVLIGINRISIGMQSMNNTILKSLGRVHTHEEFLQTYKAARKVRI